MKKDLVALFICIGLLFISSIFSFETLAVPSTNQICTFRQADGSKISLVLIGDEYFHYYSTLDSIPVFENDESFYYGFLENGKICVSNLIAHEKGFRSKEEDYIISRQPELIEHIRKIRFQELEAENGRRFAKKTKKSILGEIGDYSGSKKGLVILVNFADLSFSSKTASEDFNDMFNKPGYNQNGSIGSVRDYFIDQSYGKFDLSFDVIGPVTVSQDYSYYGSNSMETGQDKRPYEMVIEACNLVDEIVDFNDYDWDKDGVVDQVFLIYAGYGESAGATSNTIWPHESHLYTRKINLDGVDIDTYACSCELSGNSGSKPNGIGTSCHEFSHCLGLPDLYDTDYSGAFGMSYWDIMNSGSYSGPSGVGEVPYGYSAFERWYAGWLDLTEIADSQEYLQLRDLETYPEAYVIYNEGNRNEYFIIENHQAEKWFQYVNTAQDMHGMMISHVDYDKKAWENNIVNPNKKHQRLSIIPADNSYGNTEEELRGDLFPGPCDITSLTKDSHIETGGKLFNPNLDGSNFMHLAVASIKEHEGIVTFDIVNTMNFPIPVVKKATDISETGYTANWEAIPDADYYIVEKTASYLWNDKIPVNKTESFDIYNFNSCPISWSFENYNEKYRVKGIIKGLQTEWSDYQSVSYSNDIKAISSDIENMSSVFFQMDGTKHDKPMKGINIVKEGNMRKKILKFQ